MKATSNTFGLSSIASIDTALFTGNAISSTFGDALGLSWAQITKVTLTFTVVSSNRDSELSELVSASFESLRETLLTPARIRKRAWLGLEHCDILIMHLLKGVEGLAHSHSKAKECNDLNQKMI